MTIQLRLIDNSISPNPIPRRTAETVRFILCIIDLTLCRTTLKTCCGRNISSLQPEKSSVLHILTFYYFFLHNVTKISNRHKVLVQKTFFKKGYSLWITRIHVKTVNINVILPAANADRLVPRVTRVPWDRRGLKVIFYLFRRPA